MIPNKIYGRFSKPSWLTPKHHLFVMRMHKKLFKAIRKYLWAVRYEFQKERVLRRVAKIHISKTSSGLEEMGCCRLWRCWNFPPAYKLHLRGIQWVLLVRRKRKRAKPLIKRRRKYYQIGLVSPEHLISYWDIKIPDL